MEDIVLCENTLILCGYFAKQTETTLHDGDGQWTKVVKVVDFIGIVLFLSFVFSHLKIQSESPEAIMSQTVMKPKLWIKVTSTDQDENTAPPISPAYERIRNVSESGSSASPCNSSCCLGPKSPAAGSGATTPSASPVSPGYLQRKRRSTTFNECKSSYHVHLSPSDFHPMFSHYCGTKCRREAEKVEQSLGVVISRQRLVLIGIHFRGNFPKSNYM